MHAIGQMLDFWGNEIDHAIALRNISGHHPNAAALQENIASTAAQKNFKNCCMT